MDLQAALERVDGLEVETIQVLEGGPRRSAGPKPWMLEDARIRYGSVPIRLAVRLEEAPDARGLSDRLAELKRRSPKGAVAMLAAPYIGPAMRRRLEQAGVAWLDSLGNIHVHRDRPSLLLHIEARGTRASLPRFRGRLFSPAHGRVARALLERPHEAHRLKELAMVADTDASSVSRAMKVFVEANLVERRPDGWHLPDPGALLDSWLDRTLMEPRSRPERAFFTREPVRDLIDRIVATARGCGCRVALTGIHAATASAFSEGPVGAADGPLAAVEVYVDPFVGLPQLVQLLGVPASSPARATLFLLASPHGGAFVGVDDAARPPVVGRMQLLTDLYRSGRDGEEVAQLLRARWSV